MLLHGGRGVIARESGPVAEHGPGRCGIQPDLLMAHAV